MDQELWQAVKTTVATLPEAQPGADLRECRHAARCRWPISLLYLAGKLRLVPATESLVAELRRDREAHDLRATPGRNETRPLLLSKGADQF